MSTPTEPSFATTLRVRDTCLCLHVQRAARALARRFDEALRPTGLTSFQYSLLHALNRPEPPSMGPVAALLGMDRTTLTANLKVLAARGMVEIVVDPADRRSRRLKLLPAGRQALVQAIPIWEAEHGAREAALGGMEPVALRAGLRALG